MRPRREAASGSSGLPERILLPAVYAGLALVLLTPLVWAPATFHPYTVGKAVYARSAIAVTFALWALLAALRPRFRPRCSGILLALLAGLLTASASAAFGVSPQRSLWSTYQRMDGLVDTAHWVAFAVVLMATMRGDRAWNRLLGIHLCVGLATALAAVVRFHSPDFPLFGPAAEYRYPRVSATTANPTFLGAYLQATALLAAGFLARARHGKSPAKRWPARLFWAATAACSVFALTLTGSMGAVAGLAAGAAAAAALHAWLGRSRRARRLGFAGLGALGAGAVLFGLVVAARSAGAADGRAPGPAFDSILLERITSAERVGNTLASRLDNWGSGLRAFAERPLLGWGPYNYFVASARSIPRPEKVTRVRDRAHNVPLEEAVTTGIPGAAAYLLLWGFTGFAVVRGARAADSRNQALAIFAGAALAGWLVQSLTLFYSPSSRLQHMLLLALAARFAAKAADSKPAAGARRSGAEETAAGRFAGLVGDRIPRAAAAARLPAFRAAARRALRGRTARAAAVLTAAALAAASLTANRAIHAGSAAIYRAETAGPFLEEMERSMEAFRPLANTTRVILFNNVAVNWPVLTEHRPAQARRLLRWMGEEAEAALATEPESWVIHHALTRLYRAFARTHPEYAEAARRHFDRSLELAPNLDPLEAPVAGAPRR